MKLRKLPLLLISTILMSCGGVESLTIAEGRAVVDGFTSATYANYTIDAHIYIAALPVSTNSVSGLTKTLTLDAGNTDTLAANIENELVSSSYYLRAPLQLTSTNYYVEKGNPAELSYDAANADKANCVYGIIHSLLIYASGSTSSLYMRETEEGGLIFFATNSDTFLTILNVNNIDFGDGNPLVYTGNFAGRINGEFEYNKEGYLVRETVWSINYKAEKVATDPTMLFLESTYTYA